MNSWYANPKNLFTTRRYESEYYGGDLIDPIRKCWNKELVTQIFLPFEVDRVLSIPISSRLPEDTLCWDLEKDGCYSVRSAYKALWGG